MALRLRGSTSGYAEIDAPAVAGDVTLTLPSTTGTINVKDASGNTEVGTGVTFGNPGANIFTIDTNGSERLRIAADGTVSIPGALNVSGVLTYEDVTSVDAIGLSTFRDGLNTKDVGITTISTSVSDTAVDVFIYDTSKDSDGGEWRKRTSHTSWYNETLNTSTRGSRKEFPAVAVIVAETGKVTIYDGDDPDLPMWMVFNGTAGGASHNLLVSTGTFCLSALNGTVFMGALAIYVNFISEYSRGHRSTGGANYWNGPYNGNIAERNAGKGSTKLSDKLILGGSVDVAMTVLPNAPIDSATGLPVPTIAVATDGGTSIIKDDGTIVDITEVSAAWSSNLVEFFDGKLIHNDHLTGTNSEDYLIVSDIPASDTNYLAGGVNYNHASTPKIVYSRTHDNTKLVSLINNTFALGSVDSTNHLTLLSHETTQSQSMVAFATTSYNTGWMHGDIKGAFLSEKTTGTLSTTDLELITNGDFSNGTTGWFSDQILTESGGVASVQRNAGSTGQCYQTITTEVGRTYTVSVLVSAISNGFQVYKDTSSAEMSQGAVNTTGTHYWSFTATATSTRLDFSAVQSGTATASFDNITIFDGVADRSVNKKALTVYGTGLTRSVVATGADLVAYSGFGNSNYLEQPYNTDLNFGTGDFSLMNWIYVTAGGDYQVVFDRWSPNGGNARFYYGLQTEEKIYFHHREDSSSNSTDLTGSTVLSTGVWHHMAAVRRGASVEVYLNGKLDNSTTSTVRNVTPATTQPILRIGNNAVTSPSDPMLSKLALLRISGSAPSAEQIKKIYEDEKVLFQENAKATLYGSSDAVTALAYDEVTDQLHVGTSSGRSDFQGLRRINNTTQEVQTAISAHDTFIVEQ